MKKVFIDTDVIIDFLVKRNPFEKNASIIFSLADEGKLICGTSSLSITTLFYVIRKVQGRKNAIDLIRQLTTFIEILPVDQGIIHSALFSKFKDFEDAVQHFTARNGGYKLLVTRNVKDYTKSDLAVFSPESFIRSI